MPRERYSPINNPTVSLTRVSEPSLGECMKKGLSITLTLGLLTLSPIAIAKENVAHENDVAIVGATIIDVANAGRSTHDRPNATILIHNGLVAAVGDRGKVVVPEGARVIDASGSYVVPGLIDGFGSLRSQDFADAYLYEGVTTVYVIQSPAGGDGEQVIADTPRGPRLLRGATISGYSPTGAMPTTHPWTEHRLHDRRLSNADLLREIDSYADSGVRGLLIGLDVLPEQLDLILAEARRRHLATTGEPAFTTYPYAIRAGIGSLLRNDHYETALAPPEDLLAYAEDPTRAVSAYRAVCRVDLDSSPLAELGAQLATSHTALMPVLSIEATADDVGAPNPWLSRSAAFVKPADLDDPVDPKTGARPYLESHPDRREAIRACAIHRQEIDGALHRKGATYLAGSGSPAFGILPGGGVHQELRLLQHIGLTPREALAAATSNFAEVYGWTDVGRIEAGRAGDLLVVGSDPRGDVAALDDIRVVVHDGQVVDREALLASAVARHRATAPAGSSSEGPRPFAPEVEWPLGSDASPAFTPDGRTVFFTHAVGAARTIMVSHFANGSWSKPEAASFSGTWRDIEPAMAPDGSYLVFISNRPAAPGGQALDGFFGGAVRPGAGGNIWRVNRVGEGWGEPIRLPEVVNSHSAIYSPAVAGDGSLYFNQPDPVTKKSHIYRAQSTGSGFLAAVALPFNHGELGDFDAAVAPDESFLLFSSNRSPAPQNDAVLFVSFKRDGQWTPPQALQPITAGLEARLSPDLKTLYFSAEVAPSASSPAGSTVLSRIFQMPLELTAARSAPAPAPKTPIATQAATIGAPPAGDVRDFAFLVGRWTVHHHRLKARLAGSNEWEDFPGTLANWTTLGGQGNVGDNVMEAPAGTIRGLGIRSFDVKTSQWSVWWLDTRNPTINPPMKGGFQEGVGTFLADDTFNGRPIKVRVRWSQITPTSAHWEQAYSADGGTTWEINWTSDFTRVPSGP